MNSPVVLLVFNRPDCTAQVFSCIREARPTKLYVVADGPRENNPDDILKCALVRDIIERGVDWPCKINREYATTNLGCAKRVSSGLDAVFAHEEHAIILEDDCVPDPSFFQFCTELLARYRHETRVGHIAGMPLFWNQVVRPHSYLFSRYGSIWGWATWRRAWQHYDLNLHDWPRHGGLSLLRSLGFGMREARKRSQILQQLHDGNLHTWDYQWSFAKWKHSLWSVVPTVPLVTNIGIGSDASHVEEPAFVSHPAKPITFPLVHPTRLERDEVFDGDWSRCFAPSIVDRVRRRLGRERETSLHSRV